MFNWGRSRPVDKASDGHLRKEHLNYPSQYPPETPSGASRVPSPPVTQSYSPRVPSPPPVTQHPTSTAARFPSPPPVTQHPTSYASRVPSPSSVTQNPTSTAARFPKHPPSGASRVPSPPLVTQHQTSTAARFPSPPPVTQHPTSTAARFPPPPPFAPRLAPPVSSDFRVPSPPPRDPRIPLPTTNDQRGKGGKLVKARKNPRAHEYEHIPPPDQSTPPPLPLRASQIIPRKIDIGYSAPLDGAANSSSGWSPHELKRSEDGRTPNRRVVSPTHLTGQPWGSTPTASVDLSNSSFGSSRSGVLGDKAYQYRVLQDMEFRLVRLLPERKTMIKCEILHSSLENPPRYVALSYAWGDAGNTRKIELEGSLIPISVSLYGALGALRQKAESVMVWVDALCIDQQNRDERTRQVQLMTSIYSTAESVAIWLGPEEDDSARATDLLRDIADQAESPERVLSLMLSRVQSDLIAVVALFERDYWRRLWVVQEIYNARSIAVYCGSTKLPWKTYQLASQTFSRYRRDLDHALPGSRRDSRRITLSPNQLSASQVLVYQGPASLPDLQSYTGLQEDALLAVLRACRRKITSDAKDKLFGVLGILPEAIRNDFRADYNLSVKDIYTEIVDYLLKTTERVDVICDAIHFPIHTGSANLPSYVPDWSHIPQTIAVGHAYHFSAGGTTKAKCKFLDERLNKLEMSAIYLDTINIHGVAVGTICTIGDYLMAFLHWRALLLGSLVDNNETNEWSLLVQEDFCKTISLGQIPAAYNGSSQWLTTTYHVFASLIRKRLPQLPLDPELQKYVGAKVDIKPEEYRQFLQKHFGDRMMGRCFCRTEEGRIGMGTGLMLPGDVVVVPLGCSTPVLLRLEGTRCEYRFVGDVYINGYMDGRAVEEWNDGKRELRKYVLH